MLPCWGRRFSYLIDCLLVCHLACLVVRSILCCCVIIFELFIIRFALHLVYLYIASKVTRLQACLVVSWGRLIFKVINMKIFVILRLGHIHLARLHRQFLVFIYRLHFLGGALLPRWSFWLVSAVDIETSIDSCVKCIWLVITLYDELLLIGHDGLNRLRADVLV